MADLASIGLRADFREIQQAEKALSNLGAQSAKTEMAVDKFGNSISRVDADAGRFIDAAGRMRESTGRFVSVADKAGDTVAATGAAISRTATQIADAAADTRQAGNQMAGGLNNARGAVQQLGFQVQDIAVQLQAGTNALVVLGQQGSQIAGLFGPTGAVVGALLAVGSAVAYALLPSIMSSKSAADELQKAMDLLAESAERTDGGILELTESMKELAKYSQAAADAQFAAVQLQSAAAIKQASAALAEYVGELTGASVGLYDIESALKQVGNIFTSNGQVVTVQGKALQEVSTEIGEALGKTGDAALKTGASVIRMIDALGKAKTPQEISNIRDQLLAVGQSAGLSDEKLAKFITTVNQYAQAGIQAAETSKLMAESTGKEIPQAATKAESAIKAYSQALQIARAEAEGNTEKAYLLRAAFAAGYETIKEIPAPLRAIATELAGIEINEKFIKQMEQVEEMLQAQFDAMEELDAIEQRRFDRREQALQDQFDAEAELVEIYEKQNKRLSETVTLSEKAAERIEEAMADAWLNAFDGFESMADGIKNAFKRMLAEMAHMALTKPIMLKIEQSISGMMGGTGALGSLGSILGPAAGLYAAGSALSKALGGTGNLLRGGVVGDVLLGKWKTESENLNLGLSGGDVTGSTQTTNVKKKFFKNRRETFTESFDTTELDAAFDEIQSALTKAAEQIGITGASEVLNNFTASFSMSIKDKSQAEIDKAIQDWISGTTSSMVEAVFGDMLSGLQQSGETLLQTLDRVSTNMATVSAVTESLGLKYGLTGKAAAEAATRIVDLAGGLQALTALTSQYYQSFYTEAERQLMLQQQLATAFGELNMVTPSSREAFRAIVDGIDLTTEAGQKLFAELMKLVPGLDQFLSAIEAQKKALDDNRLNLQIRLLEAQGNATDALALRRQMELAATDESLRAMLLAIYAAEDAARAQNELAAAQEKAAQAAAQAAAAAESVARDAFGKLQDAAQREIKAADDVLKSKLDAINAERAALNDSNKLLIDGYNNQIKAVEQYANKLEGLNGVINDFLGGGVSGGADPFKRLTQILSEARAGLTPDQGELSSVFGAIRSSGSAGFASAEDQAFAMARALNQAQQLGGIVSGRLGVARSQVQLIEQQIKDATDYYEKQLEKLDEAEKLAQEQHDEAVALVEKQLHLAQSQLDALLGIDNRMLTLNQAMLEFGAALNELRNAQQAKPAQADPAMLELLKELVAGNESIAKHTKTSADALEFDKYRAAEATA